MHPIAPDDQILVEALRRGEEAAFVALLDRHGAALVRFAKVYTTDSAAAEDAYRRALDADPDLADAHVNLGRLLHEQGKLRQAEAAYLEGLDRCGPDATLLYNLAVLLEDLKQPQAAARSYRAALDAEPELSDAHYNLARLCANLGLQQEALRHWSAFRKLTGSR
jgi:tetratricopeptide (TPR) repeat protein